MDILFDRTGSWLIYEIYISPIIDKEENEKGMGNSIMTHAFSGLVEQRKRTQSKDE